MKKAAAPVPIDNPPQNELIAHALRQVASALTAISQIIGSSGPLAPSAQDARAASAIIPFAALSARPALVGEERTLKEVVDEFLVAKARAKKADRYLRYARTVLCSFAKGRTVRPISELTAQDAESWIYGTGWEAPTMRRAFAQLRTVLRWAMRKGYLAKDFAEGVELPPDLSGQAAPKITAPTDVRKILETAFGIDPDAGRHLALRYFAGVRACEVFRLREENIWLEKGYVEIPAALSKGGRRRRLVKIEPVLRAWLKRGGQLRAMDPDYISQVRDFAKVPYSDNAPRKSFISYHVARGEDAAATALQAGTSEAKVFSNYNQGAVTKETAEEFWNLFPPAALEPVSGFKRKPKAFSQAQLIAMAERKTRKAAAARKKLQEI